MKAFTLLAIAATAGLAHAHTTVWAVWVNGVNQGLGNTATGYIRSPPNNNPVKDLTSPAMACNVNNVAVPNYVTVKPGDNVTFEWHHNDDSPSDDILATSHKGPVQVYMAPMTSSQGSGPIWQKLAEKGYDPTSKTWATDDLIANKGKHSVIVPNVADGNYFMRPEIIALHEANSLYDQDSSRGAQFYLECVQMKVTGGSGSAMPAGVSFPGAYKDNTPGVQFNIYNSFSTYPIPGPTVWTAGAAAATSAAASPTVSSSSVASSAAASSSTSQTSVATSADSSTSSSAAAAATTTASSIAMVSSAAAVPASSGTFVNSITGSLVWIYTPTGAAAGAEATSSVSIAASSSVLLSSVTNVAVPTTLATSVKSSGAAASPSASSTSASSDDGDGDDCSDDGEDSGSSIPSPVTAAAPSTASSAAAASSSNSSSDGDDGDCDDGSD
ncbi:MAG: hypothetical protein M1821_001796 [Bathelium mastoideum]|nr:MAG: hypothetical protein M1821_001796 [Bathelium mastoideum]